MSVTVWMYMHLWALYFVCLPPSLFLLLPLPVHALLYLNPSFWELNSDSSEYIFFARVLD